MHAVTPIEYPFKSIYMTSQMPSFLRLVPKNCFMFRDSRIRPSAVLSGVEVRCAAVIAVPERSRRQEPKPAKPN
jgi:hypothetical protein